MVATNITKAFDWIAPNFQDISMFNIDWIFSLILTFLLLIIITRNTQEWKKLLLPVSAFIHILGFPPFILVYIIAVILWTIEIVSIRLVSNMMKVAVGTATGIGRGVKAVQQRSFSKIAGSSAYNKQWMASLPEKFNKKYDTTFRQKVSTFVKGATQTKQQRERMNNLKEQLSLIEAREKLAQNVKKSQDDYRIKKQKDQFVYDMNKQLSNLKTKAEELKKNLRILKSNRARMKDTNYDTTNTDFEIMSTEDALERVKEKIQTFKSKFPKF